MQRTIFLTCISLAVVASAQQPVAPERRTEWERLGVSCPGFSFAGIASCADALFTEHPLHIAIGSLAPQNGFGAGGAFVWHWTTSNWRNSILQNQEIAKQRAIASARHRSQHKYVG